MLTFFTYYSTLPPSVTYIHMPPTGCYVDVPSNTPLLKIHDVKGTLGCEWWGGIECEQKGDYVVVTYLRRGWSKNIPVDACGGAEGSDEFMDSGFLGSRVSCSVEFVMTFEYDAHHSFMLVSSSVLSHNRRFNIARMQRMGVRKGQLHFAFWHQNRLLSEVWRSLRAVYSHSLPVSRVFRGFSADSRICRTSIPAVSSDPLFFTCYRLNELPN